MDKKQFINELVDALAGEVPSQVITENVNYYRNYLDEEVRKTHRSEQEIIEEWGAPRLIARSIIDAYEAEYGSYEGSTPESAQTVEPDGKSTNSNGTYTVKSSNGCGIVALIAVIVIFVVIMTVMRILLSVPGLIILLVLAMILAFYYSGRRS
jgi:uncharacterized membrane protein